MLHIDWFCWCAAIRLQCVCVWKIAPSVACFLYHTSLNSLAVAPILPLCFILSGKQIKRFSIHAVTQIEPNHGSA